MNHELPFLDLLEATPGEFERGSAGRRTTRLFLFLIVLTVPFQGLGGPFPYRLEPYVDVWAFRAPLPVKAEGKLLLAYELQLVSGEWQPLEIKKLRVLSESGDELACFEGTALEAITERPGFPSKDEVPFFAKAREKYPTRTIPPMSPPVERLLSLDPGQHAVFFLWLEREPSGRMPATLRHEWTFSNLHAQVPGPSIVESDRIKVDPVPAIELAPPVRPGRWFTTAGPADLSHHRRAQIESGGHMTNPQRFAIDLVKISDEDRITSTLKASSASEYYGFGEDVLAVADSTVAEILDGLPGRENLPDRMDEDTVLTQAEMAGNQVSLDLGGGRFALYAHLQPGSIRVKVGQRVHRGAVLGRIGNSGTAMGPHLHFQVSTQPGLYGEGLPFVFRVFESAPLGKPLVRRQREIPLPRRVIVFLP